MLINVVNFFKLFCVKHWLLLGLKKVKYKKDQSCKISTKYSPSFPCLCLNHDFYLCAAINVTKNSEIARQFG